MSEQWTEESCSGETLVDQSCGWGDNDDICQTGCKDGLEPSTKASCSEWVCGDHSRQGTDDDDEYKNGLGDDAVTEPEQSPEDGGSERTNSGDENEDELWEIFTEESVSETTDDDQTHIEHIGEAQPKASNAGWEDYNNDALLSPPENRNWNRTENKISEDSVRVDQSQNSEHEEDRVKSPAEIIYDELPFVTKHYFLHHALHILEAICFRIGQQPFRHYLDDMDWKRRNLVINPEGYDPDTKRVYGDWITEDGVEVKWWVWFYGERAPGIPRNSQTADILESIYILRNAALHRGDTGGLDFKEWELAMQVPVLLGDAVGEKEMVDLAAHVLGDGTMDEDVMADVERKMYTPRPNTTKYRLLERIQTLLEESCFNLALKKIPDVLTVNEWDCAERVELKRWTGIFENTEVVADCDELATALFSRYDSEIWTSIIISLLHYARKYIRNAAAHREPVSNEDLVNRVHAAIRAAILMSDWPRAFEIEIAYEMWFEGTSRQGVLERLARSYRDGNIETEYEWRRRRELEIFLRNQRGKEEEEEEGDEGLQMMSAECDAKEEILERAKTRSTWSPSMHKCLKRVEVVEVVAFIQDLGEEENKKLASDTCEAGKDSENEEWGTLAEWADSRLCRVSEEGARSESDVKEVSREDV